MKLEYIKPELFDLEEVQDVLFGATCTSSGVELSGRSAAECNNNGKKTHMNLKGLYCELYSTQSSMFVETEK